MGNLEHWGAGRWGILLLATFFIAAFLAIGIFFRLGDESFAAQERARDILSVTLAGAIVVSWLFLLICSAIPQLRSVALLLLIIAFVAAMAGPSLLLLVS